MSITIFYELPAQKQYPKYLENEKLPLMQPAIAKLVKERLSFPQAPAQLVSEYACPADQVETRGMLEFIESEISTMILLNMKAEQGEVSACFEEKPYLREDIFRNSTPLKNTTERRLAALMCAYFSHRNFEYDLTLKSHERVRMDQNNQEYYDLLGRILGVTILTRCIATEDDRVSHTITFGQRDWYKNIDPVKILLGEPKKVFRFLRGKGYEKSQKPARGQIVVYHIPSKVRHYGKIVKISDDQIMVISKLGRAHLCEHPVEITQCHYGNAVTFLTEPKKDLT